MILAAAAAAAAAALFLKLAEAGLSVPSREIGLRARCDSDSRRDGDLERRSVSKRERAGRSGSSLSKRDRGRRSSDMVRWALRDKIDVRRGSMSKSKVKMDAPVNHCSLVAWAQLLLAYLACRGCTCPLAPPPTIGRALGPALYLTLYGSLASIYSALLRIHTYSSHNGLPARSTAAAQPPQQAMRRHPPPATEGIQLLIYTGTRLQGPPPPHRAAPNRRPPSGMVGACCRQQHSLRDTTSVTGPPKESHPQLLGPERARCAVPCIRYPGRPWLQH